MRTRTRRGGTVYVLVLGVTALLMVFGVGGLLLARSVSDRHDLQSDQASAALLAESYLDLIPHRLSGSNTWRSTHANDTWTHPGEALDRGIVQYKLIDPDDRTLNNGSTDRVRLYARATVNDAVRIYSVELTCHDGLTLERDWATLRRDTNN